MVLCLDPTYQNNASWHFQDSRFAGRVNVNLTALTGMSFGGFTTAACLEEGDSRVKAAIMMCLSLEMLSFFFLRDLHKNALSIHMKISRIWVDFFSIHFQHSKVVVFFPNPLREVPLLADVGQWPSYKRKDQHEDTSHDDDW